MRRFALLLTIAGPSASLSAARADVIVAYEAASRDKPTDTDIYARLLKPDGTLGWNADQPLEVATSKDIETSPVVVADGAGGAFVIYEYQFTEGENQGDMDIVAQHIGADGTLLWNEGEAPTPIASSKASESRPVAISDGAGGFIVAYEWRDEEGDVDILAQRVDSKGESLWENDDTPAVVASSPAPERNPVIVPDGEGGAIFVFEWENEEGATDVMAQRVRANGTVPWNNGEQAIDVAATANNERAPTAVPDGRGGALVAFEVEFLEGEFKGDVDIMGQRISRDGVVMWNGGEEASTVASGKGIERKPVAVGDGVGGMIVAFEYEPLEGEFAGDIDIFAQRVDGDGKMLWQEGKQSAVVSSAPGLERAPSMVPLPNAQAIVAVEHEFRKGDNAGDIDILAQRLDAEGKMLWNEGEKSTMVSGAKWLERVPIALPDGQGGAIVIFAATGPEGEFEGDEDVEASRISGDGVLVWKDGERSVDIASSDLLEGKPSAAVVK
jgi:hypothetical protein